MSSQVLITALQTAATNKLTAHHAANDKPEFRQELQDLFGLKANGLHLFEKGTEQLQDFAEVIETHKGELYPWVTVYGAATGFMGVWSRVLAAWVQGSAGPADPVDPEALGVIDNWVPNYVRMIAG